MASDQFLITHKRRHASVLSEFRDEIPMRETRSADEIPRRETTSAGLADRGLLDALRRHREILRRETDYLKGEVKSRGFATFAGKKAYMKNQSNGRIISPPFPELFDPRIIQSVGVSLPYLVTDPQESVGLLLRESHHLRLRIQSLASILRKFSIPISSDKDKMLLFLMSRAAVIISKIMQVFSQRDATSSQHLHRVHWESIWGSRKSHGVFDDITTLSPMQFTPSTPGIPPYTAAICPALQIYSLKIVQLNVNLNWPLHVYGVVSARDTVDRNRNLLFYRSRANYQLVTEADPYLRLTGPSRAIVAAKPVKFEVELRLKYPGAEHQDRALFHCTYNWRAMPDTTPLFRGYACAAELSLEPLPSAIQATIVGVRLVTGSWPSTHGCRVSCSLSAAEDSTPREVELLNWSAFDDKPIGANGYFRLARNVVSAQLESTLKVVFKTKSRLDGPHSHVEFPVQQCCQTSKGSCSVVNCKVEVVVAWSPLVEDKQDLMIYW